VLNVTGRGSVDRFAQAQQAQAAQRREPIRVQAVVGEPVKPAPETAPEPATEVPAGSATEVLAWVDGDQGRAALALDAEKLRPSPRTGLTAQLEKIVG
jgi:hypothetical protein